MLWVRLLSKHKPHGNYGKSYLDKIASSCVVILHRKVIQRCTLVCRKHCFFPVGKCLYMEVVSQFLRVSIKSRKIVVIQKTFRESTDKQKIDTSIPTKLHCFFSFLKLAKINMLDKLKISLIKN